jgi:hypothetical protein
MALLSAARLSLVLAIRLSPMEIQESILRNVHLLMGWQASPRYSDRRGELTEHLRQVAGSDNEWSWDGPMTLVSGEEKGIDLALSPTELILATEAPSQELGDVPERVASFVLDQLAIPEVRLVGAGCAWLAPVSGRDDLNSWLSANLGAFGTPALYDAFGGKPSSFIFEAEIEEEGFSFDLELRPLTASEAAASDDFKSEEEDSFPPVALYLEVIRSEVGDLAADAAARSFASNLEKVLTAAQKFDLALREKL